MTAKAINIDITASGKLACIQIKNTIYEGDGNWVEYQIDNLLAQGITDCEIELNSQGGNVFAANQIANKIKSFPGRTVCKLGSICASASTYIASSCQEIIASRNTQYMFHKPQMPAQGNVDEIKAQLKLLDNLTKDYKKTYAKLTGLSETDIEAMWQQDYWMNAEEALEKGFITAISDCDAPMDNEVVAQLEALKYPRVAEVKAKLTDTINLNNNTMKYPLISAALQLPEDSSEADIASAISKLNAKANQLETENEELKKKVNEAAVTAQAELNDKVSALVEGAVAANKIQATDKERYEKLAKADFKSTSEILGSMKPYMAVTSMIGGVPANAAADPYAGWDYGKYQKEAPEVLAKMQKTDPEKFNQLKKEYIASL